MKLKTKYTSSYLAIDMILFAKSLMDYIISKYSLFNSLNAHHKVVSPFNSIDAFICKKLGSFIYEAFALRNESIETGIVN